MPIASGCQRAVPAGRQLRAPRVLSVVALALAAIALAACGSTSKSARTPVATGPSAGPYHGALANPPFPARALALRNYDGRPVDIRQFRGKAVLVTFIYTHCPDVCPLIVSNLRTAQAQLGSKAGKLQIVAVSVDPRGDTQKTVTAFLGARQMLGRMDYLIGARRQLQAVWKRWGILSKADPSSPDQVEHSALIYGIGADGNVRTLYPANFKPQWIVADVPKLVANAAH